MVFRKKLKKKNSNYQNLNPHFQSIHYSKTESPQNWITLAKKYIDKNIFKT